MKKILSTLAASAVMLLSGNANSQNLGKNLLSVAKMDGSQQVPKVITTGMGLGGFTLNATKDTVFVNISFHGLSSPLSSIHIHNGLPGANGSVVVDLTSFVKGQRIVTALTGSNVPSIAKMLKGELYVNLHTTAFPEGEIRGQINLDKDWGLSSKLDGAQQTPAVATSAMGFGLYKVSKDKSKIKIKVVANGLSGAITSAHFHKGAPGATGGVIKDLSTLIDGNSIVGEVDSTGLINDLIAGNVYINLHTGINDGGEIRGQVTLNKQLCFDAWGDGAQQVPALSTPGKGVISVKVAPSMDTLWYDAVLTNLSGPITSAHLHKGAKGADGGVVVDLFSGISGNMVSGKITGPAVTTELVNGLLDGTIYFNAHTTDKASGEVRGQLMRQARVGYTASIDGLQQTPPTISKGNGVGVVSIDRDWSELEYHVLVSGLTQKISGAHFHSGMKGQSGGILYDLTPSFAKMDTFDHAKGFIKMPSLTVANAMKFHKDSVYINLHNELNQNGEIRGQVLKSGKAEIITSVDDATFAAETNLVTSPNPTSDKVNVNFASTQNGVGSIAILDMMGQELYSQPINITSSNNVQLNVENLVNGVYMIQVKNGNNKIVKKVIKF